MRDRLTVDGLRDLVQDLRKEGRVPAAILVSPFDAKDLKFDLMAGATETSPDAEATVNRAIAIIEGVAVVCHRDVSRGKAKLLYHQQPPINATRESARAL